MKHHVTKDGKKILLSDLEDSLLLNIINFIKRKAKEGLVISYGGGSHFEGIWYDEETIYAKEVKKRMGYKHYKRELKSRDTLKCKERN